MRKKSAQKACDLFIGEVGKIQEFLDETSSLTDHSVSRCYDYAIIWLYRSFEEFILTCLVCAINNDTEQLSLATNIEFPRHLTDEVCEFIIVGSGYFDFKGRDGMIRKLRQYLPEQHYLVHAIKTKKYEPALDRLSALRNFAAHESKPSKRAALKVIGAERISSSGAWLKKQNRFTDISDKLEQLASDIAQAAPY